MIRRRGDKQVALTDDFAQFVRTLEAPGAGSERCGGKTDTRSLDWVLYVQELKDPCLEHVCEDCSVLDDDSAPVPVQQLVVS